MQAYSNRILGLIASLLFFLAAAGSTCAQGVTELRTPSVYDSKIHFSGFAQGWFADGLGSRIGSSEPGSALYQGRNFGLAGSSGILLRRAELSAYGNADSRWYYRGMVDIAPMFDNRDTQNILQDMLAGFQIDKQFALELGRQTTGLGIEGSTDDNRLLTIARSIMNEDLPMHVGRLGDSRSTGAVIRYTGKDIHSFVGLWIDPSSPQIAVDAARPLFADASVSYIGVPRLLVSVFGGSHVLAGPGGEVTDRTGGAIKWQRGPHVFQGELDFARDYSASSSPGGTKGTSPLGGYFMYGYSITRKLQVVVRYDNFDEGQQRQALRDETTETGILIPHANHKLREYTLGINYHIDGNQKAQLNLIRDDTEDNGAVYWGPQRTLLMAAYQIGFNAPDRPEDLRGANASTPAVLEPITNAIHLGPNFGPTLGFSAAVNIGLPRLHLMPGMSTRTTFGLLGDAHAPSVFGFPGTTYLAALDQVTRGYHLPGMGASVYGGFGGGGYFQGRLQPGLRLLLGTNLTPAFGLELVSNITGIGRPYLSLETRFPL